MKRRRYPYLDIHFIEVELRALLLAIDLEPFKKKNRRKA